jgi:hypothetical protein
MKGIGRSPVFFTTSGSRKSGWRYEEDALPGDPILGGEVFHLRREVDGHAEALAGRVRQRHLDLAELVEVLEKLDRELHRRDAEPVRQHCAARLRYGEDVREVHDAEIRGIPGVHEHRAVAHAADVAVAILGDEEEVLDERAGRSRLVGVVDQELADRLLALHLAVGAEGVPEELVSLREVFVIGVEDRPEFDGARLALDHLHDVLVEEVAEAQPYAFGLRRHSVRACPRSPL